MVIGIIVGIISAVLFFFLASIVTPAKSEKRQEDEEQMRWIHDYKKKNFPKQAAEK